MVNIATKLVHQDVLAVISLGDSLFAGNVYCKLRWVYKNACFSDWRVDLRVQG